MIATRFRSVTWVAGVATAALGCYLVSQSVASERAGLARIDRQIAAAQADIGRLRTEIATRSRMGQLDRWNADVLALQAPNARQFLASETQLAGLDAPRGLPIDQDIAATKGAVELAAYHAPAAPPPERSAPGAGHTAPAAEPQPQTQTQTQTQTQPQPLLRVATYVRPQADRLGSDDAVPLVRAALTRPAPKAVSRPAAKVVAGTAATTHHSSLLPDDIDSLAAAERRAKGRK